jgi:hypothetical protein
MWPLIKSAIRSRVGVLFLYANLCLIVAYFAPLEPVDYSYDPDTAARLASYDEVITGRFIGGRYTDFDSTALWVLVALNLLPLLSGQVALKCVILLWPGLSVHALSWVYAYLLVTLCSVQWLLVGHFVERMFKLYRASA